MRRIGYGVLMVACLVLPSAAAAQAIGSGPLTGTLVDTEPTSGIFDLGLVTLAPGLTINELGYDSNVFDESVNPKEDWVFRGRPDIAVFSLLRWVKVSAYAGSELSYYKTYEDERAAGYEARARLDFTVSRLYPFIGGGHTKSRTRPNGEIDTRADSENDEISGGVAFELAAHSVLYGSAVRAHTEYKDAIEEGVDLATSLNRTLYSYSGGIRSDVTPITTLTLAAGINKDEFELSPIRNVDDIFASATLRIGTEALISGTATVAYRDVKPVDPLIHPYRGLTGEGSLTYSLLEIGRLSGAFKYGLEYSFDEAEGYYKETMFDLAYTHRLFGEVDAQIRGTKSWFEYGNRDGVVPHTDTLLAVGASVGYNLRNRTRISLNYEEAQRRSPAFLERNYDRTRVYLAWQYAF